MKLILPWVLVVFLGLGLGWQLTVTQSKEVELARLRGLSHELEGARIELEQQQDALAKAQQEVERLQAETKELLRLRNEVAQLRKETQQLTRDLQTARNQAQNAQAQVQSVQAHAQSLTEQAQQAQRQLEAAQTNVASQARARFLERYGLTQAADPQASACLANLRAIDSAKAQWALENQQPQGASVSAANLAAYLDLANNPQVLSCPAGGTYQITPVGASSTCSVPAHASPAAAQPQ